MVRWHSWSGLSYLYGVMDSGDYWAKAEENLEMALLAYKRKKHNVCASRAYYSVFLASIAALIALTDLRAKDNEWGSWTSASRVEPALDCEAESLTTRNWANADGSNRVTTCG